MLETRIENAPSCCSCSSASSNSSCGTAASLFVSSSSSSSISSFRRSASCHLKYRNRLKPCVVYYHLTKEDDEEGKSKCQRKLCQIQASIEVKNGYDEQGVQDAGQQAPQNLKICFRGTIGGRWWWWWNTDSRCSRWCNQVWQPWVKVRSFRLTD